MEAYILSAGRPNTQPTWDALPQSVRDFTRVVIQQTERELYAEFIEEFPDNYLILPVEINRISPTRQYLLEFCQSEKLIMLDDDLTFSYRATASSVTLTPQLPQEVERMFTDIADALDNYAHVAVSTREGNNRVEQSTKEVGRALRFHAMVAPTVRQHARFDRIEFKQDFDYTLQMLRAGHPNLIFYNYAHNQPGSNKPGGCSTYRNHEVLDRCAHELYDLHPNFVTVVNKETKGAWGGGVRTDVRIKWKQAYESSLK